MKLPNDRLLLHLARDRRRVVDPRDVYFLEANANPNLEQYEDFGVPISATTRSRKSR